ncbi:hypothetical protein [Massilia sp. SYSU DXS3249]
MVLRVLTALALVLVLAGQACEHRGLSGIPVAKTDNPGRVMMLRVRLGEGFQNNTVSVRINGEQVFQKSGVSTDWTISRADSLEVKTEAAAPVQLEVAVEGGPTAVKEIVPGQTPFVEVRLVSGVLELHPMNEESPMM